MRGKYLVAILVLLVLALPASPAQAGGVVSVCDETHLLAALTGGGTVTFACSGTITLTSTIIISADTSIDGSLMKWCFRDITPDSFRWTGESSSDQGKTWHLGAEFFAERIADRR